MNLKNILDRWINWGTSLPATPWQLAALFAVTVILRNLMEAVPQGIIFSAPAFVLHFPVAYVYPLLTLVFFMRIFSRYSTEKLLRIMVLAWTLTLLPPLIDSVTGTTSTIGYFPLERSNAAWFLLNFFNPAVQLSGTTTGIRIEAALGCVLAGIFTWAVAPGRRRLLRGILNAIVFAPVFLTFFTWPYLITILFQPLFPGDGLTNSLLQWHASTGAPVTGASHFITFLIDMVPVSFLSLWFVRELSPANWLRLKKNLTPLMPPLFSAVIGSAAALAVIPRGGMTFADSVIIAGSLLACLWLITGSGLRGSFRAVPSAVALIIAWACGWETLVFAGFALAVSGLPGSDRLRIPLFSVAVFITALSPVGFSLTNPPAVLAILLILVISIPTLLKRRFGLLFTIPLGILLVYPPASETGAWQRELQRRTDTFARSSRVALAMESASRLAAGGGSWIPLAQTTHTTGLDARCRYICETAMARGETSTDLMKVVMNLAFTQGDTTAFNNAYSIYLSSADPSELSEAITMRVTFLALSGDTTSMNAIHSRAGMNPMLLRSMATAYLVTGDTLRSLQYSIAFLDTPAAAAGDWAWAITLSAATGSADWYSIYNRAEEKFGYCLPVMLARLRAPVIAGIEPDRRDLLRRCILVKPDGAEVLETAAMWYSAAGIPDSALIFASRAIAGTSHPSAGVFSLAVNSALASGNQMEALASVRYALSEYPGNRSFQNLFSEMSCQSEN